MIDMVISGMQSFLFLSFGLDFRCGTLVSGDSTGSIQFWDSCHGTLLQGQRHHKGDVLALATAPNHKRVFSAGSDGQVPLFLTMFITFFTDHCCICSLPHIVHI